MVNPYKILRYNTSTANFANIINCTILHPIRAKFSDQLFNPAHTASPSSSATIASISARN